MTVQEILKEGADPKKYGYHKLDRPVSLEDGMNFKEVLTVINH